MRKAIPFLVIIFLAGALAVNALTRSAFSAGTASFNHLALSVYDLDKTAAFYERIIGLKKIEDPFHDGRHVWLHIGEHNQLHLIAGAAKEQAHLRDNHLSFTVPSVEEFMDRLKKEKISFVGANGSQAAPIVRADGVKQVFFQDPDGFWIEMNNDRY